jgi:hypothetical protein
MRHSSDICEPYEFEKENATTGEIEIIKKLSDSLGGSERSLLKLVKAFLSQAKRAGEGDLANQTSTGAFDDGAQVVIDEDEDQNDEQEEEIETISDGASNNEAGTMEHFNSELQAQLQVTAEFLRSKKNKKQSKWREWRMDMLRLDDFNQMRLMQKELVKLRKAKEKKRNGGASKTRQAAECASVQRPMSAVPNQVN